MSGLCPLSPAQAQLWFLHRLDPASPTYNVPWRLRLRGPLDVDALRRSVALLVERHEALRSRVVVLEGRPHQVPDGTAPRLDLVDLGDRPAAERWAAAQRASDADARSPFDLQAAAPVRGAIVRIDDHDHLFMLTVHHIVADGWSLGVLGDELAIAYAAYVEGRTPDLAPAAGIEEIASAQAEALSGGRLEELIEHWRATLSSAPTVELPTDRPRPSRLSGRGRMLSWDFAPEVSASVHAFAARHAATPFIVLLTAYKALVSRYTRDPDVIVATAFLNRPTPVLERAVGFLANMLPIRTDLGGDPSFLDAVDAVRSSSLEALSHQELPFGLLVEHLRPPRDLSRNPLVQLGLTYNGEQGTPALPGLAVERIEADTGAARLDLHLEVFETEAGLSLTAEFSEDLFAATTIERLLGRYETLLRDGLAHPERRLSELRLVEDGELRAMTASRVVTPAPDTPSVLGRFEARAVERPDAVATTDAAETMSYGALDARANRLARHLRAGAVREGDLVAICLDRGAAVPEAIAGVLKAGAAYLPLDPTYPAERLRLVLEDARPAALVTDRERCERLGAGHPRTVLLDADADRIAGQGPTAPARVDDPRRLAYVIYTSGSTGRPKGVRIDHGNVARLFTTTDDWFGFGPEDVWTLFHSYAFDFSVWELWGALAYGGRLVIVPYETSRSPRDFHALAVRERVTVLNQTPTAFAGFMRADLAAERPIGSLRYVVTGGEALDVAALAPWFEAHGDREPQIVNMYGITETTVHVSYRPIGRDDIHAGRSPIGRPLPDLALHLVDEHLRPVPQGVPGELLVAGAGVGRGYLRRDELTAERFIDDPLVPGRRCYRTGDIARRTLDGDLDYLGRKDDQVQIRGFRLELGEVRAALVAHPAVEDALAVVRDDHGEPMLVAYVVSGAEPVDGPALRRFLRDRVPAHAVPARFVPIDAVPMTVNGKADVRRLPPPGPAPDDAPASRLPRTPLERRVAAAVAAVIGADRVGVDDDFFDLGGDSLGATRLLAGLGGPAGRELSLAEFLREPTVASLARQLDGRRHGADRTARVSPLVTLAAGDETLPLVHLVHPIGGSVLCYQRLAEALRGQVGVRAFRLADVEDDDPPSLPALAERYVAELDGRPDGPLVLGGWSLGGLIAMEMAAQLRERGEPVALVAALDTPAPGSLTRVADECSLAREFAGDVAAMLGRPIRVAPGAPPAAVVRAIARAVPELGEAEFDRRWRVFRWLYRAAAALPADGYAQDLLLVTADEGEADAEEWRRIVDGTVIHEPVTADHYSLMDPPAAGVVAAALRRALDRVAEGVPS